MAEVVCVIASGISIFQLAGQLTRNIIKLKDYWAQIQDAPAEVEFLLRQVDSLGLIMNHIQVDHASQAKTAPNQDNTYLSQNLNLCKDGTRELSALVEDLADQIMGKRRWRKNVGCAKVVFKKDVIKRLKERMKIAVQLLSFSCQCHTNAMIQLQPEIILDRFTSHITSLHVEPATDKNVPNESPIQKPLLPSESSDIVVQHYNYWSSSSFRLQYFLGSLTYYQHTISKDLRPRWQSIVVGIHIRLRTYRRVPYDSSFFKAVHNGGVPRVRKMLRNCEAFVTDTSIPPSTVPLQSQPAYLGLTFGQTALHMATSNNDIEMCRMLVSEGADPLAFDDAIRDAWESGYISTFGNRNDTVDEDLDANARKQIMVTGTRHFLWRPLIRKFVGSGADPTLANNKAKLLTTIIKYFLFTGEEYEIAAFGTT
ncbi:hypothetical protein G7Y89_g5113 [Cudoniella acicularis]|uniref:Uncharacterized protein n=1 Tax=Cudoniella acicularis TaxID=354080 RepID=A0A8H4RN29_9HELO|nr:hypothetical protein G7Y89_g5113 [Cudoniella acicularis]